MKYFSIIITLSVVNSIYGSLLKFYPMSASQVYSALRRVGQEDAVPEGRFITQGLAAMTGYTAGYLTGIGVPLILNIDLANVTGILGTPSNNTARNQLRVQEICFNSRSLNEIDDYDEEEDDDDEELAENVQNEKNYKRNIITNGREIVESNDEYAFEDPTKTEAETTDMENPRRVTTSSGEPTYDDSSVAIPTTQTESDDNQDDYENMEDSRSDTDNAADIAAGTGTNLVTTRQTAARSTVNCVVLQQLAKK